MAMEVSPRRAQHFNARANRASVLGARRVSPVVVKRVDPSELQAAMRAKPAKFGETVKTIADLEPEFVEQRPAYKHPEAMNIAKVRNRVRQPRPRERVKDRVQSPVTMTRKERLLKQWNDEHSSRTKQPHSQ